MNIDIDERPIKPASKNPYDEIPIKGIVKEKEEKSKSPNKDRSRSRSRSNSNKKSEKKSKNKKSDFPSDKQIKILKLF